MTQKPKNTSVSKNRNLVIGGIVVVAVIIAFIGILLITNSSNSAAGERDYSQIPQSRAADGGFILGSPDAPVKIIAFEDFLCPHCQAYKPTVDRIIDEFVATGQAQFEYRILPAVDATYSEVAGELAVCAEELGGSFWTSHDILYEMASAERFGDRSPRQFAERVGIAYADLLDCAAEEDQANIDQELAGRMGAQGTPSVFYQIGDSAPQFLGQNRTFDVIESIIQSTQQ